MKAKKLLSHSLLLVEVSQYVTSFEPDTKQIKYCVEGLIEKSYISRDETNSNSYVYLP